LFGQHIVDGAGQAVIGSAPIDRTGLDRCVAEQAADQETLSRAAKIAGGFRKLLAAHGRYTGHVPDDPAQLTEQELPADKG